MNIEDVLVRVSSFTKEAHKILSAHETAPSRVVLLDRSYKEIGELSLAQDELLRQSLRCIENNLNRASHILAWIALIDYIENLLAYDRCRKLKAVRPKLKACTSEQLREEISDFQIIEACKDLGIINNSEMRIFHGYLSKRNLCAHPSDFYPDFNQTLGYMADILSAIRVMQKNGSIWEASP